MFRSHVLKSLFIPRRRSRFSPLLLALGVLKLFLEINNQPHGAALTRDDLPRRNLNL